MMSKVNRFSVLADVAAAVAVLALLWPDQAYAYVDPSVVTYAVQSFAAVAVAISAVVGVAFRRTRKAIFGLLGINEDAGRVKEPPVCAIGAGEKEAADESAAELAGAVAAKVSGNKRLSWPVRLLFGLLASSFTAYTVLVVAPLELVCGNAGNLVLGVGALLPPIIISAVMVAVIVGFGLSALRGKAFNVAFALVVAFGVAAYVQAMFLNVGLPEANGTPVPWSDRDKISLLSCLVWLALGAVAVVAAVKRPRQARGSLVAVAVLLVVLQSAGLASLAVDGADAQGKLGQQAGKLIVSEEGLFRVAPSDNVIVFVLDTMDTETVQKTLEAYPDLFDEYTGFTWFQNCSGSVIPTRYGIPTLLTGYTIEHGQDPADYLSNLYVRSGYLDAIAATGRDVAIYSNHAGYNASTKAYLANRAYNFNVVEDGGDVPADFWGTVGIMWQCALYRDLPWPLKRPLWYYTEDINAAIVSEADSDVTPYAMNDPLFYSKLQKNGLTIDERQVDGAFRFIHMTGAHAPYIMNDEGGLSSDRTSTLVEQSAGSFWIVEQYLRQMKALGVYDDAVIVVTADHGKWEYNVDELHYATSPVLLVKPAQNHQEAQASLACSQALVSQWDVNPTVLDSIGADPSAFPYTGVSVWSATESPRDRFFLQTVHSSSLKEDYAFREYRIGQNALDFGGYEFTGEAWDLPFRSIGQVE